MASRSPHSKWTNSWTLWPEHSTVISVEQSSLTTRMLRVCRVVRIGCSGSTGRCGSSVKGYGDRRIWFSQRKSHAHSRDGGSHCVRHLGLMWLFGSNRTSSTSSVGKPRIIGMLPLVAVQLWVSPLDNFILPLSCRIHQPSRVWRYGC